MCRLRGLGVAKQFLHGGSPGRRSLIPAFVKLSRTIQAHKEAILAAGELGLSNSKLERLDSQIRLRRLPRRVLRRSAGGPG